MTRIDANIATQIGDLPRPAQGSRDGEAQASEARRSENATVTLCHTGTRDMAAHTRSADIVVVAAGVPGLLTADMVKPGAAVLDVGITRTDAGLVGDVAPDVHQVAAWVAPMPGGVGPMTRAMLLANVVDAAS